MRMVRERLNGAISARFPGISDGRSVDTAVVDWGDLGDLCLAGVRASHLADDLVHGSEGLDDWIWAASSTARRLRSGIGKWRAFRVTSVALARRAVAAMIASGSARVTPRARQARIRSAARSAVW